MRGSVRIASCGDAPLPAPWRSRKRSRGKSSGLNGMVRVFLAECCLPLVTAGLAIEGGETGTMVLADGLVVVGQGSDVVIIDPRP